MEYINRQPCRPRTAEPNGAVGNDYTAELIAQQFRANDGVDGWKNRIQNLRIVRLDGSTKGPSTNPKRKARQACYLAIGEIQSVQDYAEKVAAVPKNLRVSNHLGVAYEDLWWDCQGGHCKGRKGVIGKPYIQFLPPDEPAS